MTSVALDQTLLIGVFNSKNELSTAVARYEPCVQRSAQIAHMHISRGAGGKAGAHLTLGNARFHFFKKIHRGFLHCFILILHNI